MSGLVIDIRRAQPSYAQSLSDAYAASWQEAYCGIIPAVQLKRMIARRGARMDARMDGSADAGEIQELYLAPEYQGIGLGVRLFEAACAALRRQDYKRVIARSLEENDRALRFYERRGGKAVGRIEETIGGKTMPQVIYEWAL